MIEITFEYLASIFFDKIYIGYEFDLNNQHYIIKKGRKYKDQISKFTIHRINSNKKISFPIYENYNTRYSENYKRNQFDRLKNLTKI